MRKILFFLFIFLFSPAPVLAEEDSLAPKILPLPSQTYDYLVIATWEPPESYPENHFEYKVEASLDSDFEKIASSSGWLEDDFWSFSLYPLPVGKIYLRVGARVLGEEEIHWSQIQVTEQKGPYPSNFSSPKPKSKTVPPHPVIFIHGLNGQPEDWKNKEENRDYVSPLLKRGFEEDLIYLYPYADYNNDGVYDFQGEIKGIAEDLPKTVERLSEEYRNLGGDGKVDIVAFSLGGLVSRSYFASKEFNNKVRKFIDIATPHRGAYLGEIVYWLDSIPFGGEKIREGFLRFATEVWNKISGGRPIDFQSPAVLEVMPKSEFLKDLNQIQKTPKSLEYFCLYGDIHATFNWKLFLWNLKSQKFSLGDLLILPESATGIPGNLCKSFGFIDEKDFEVRMIRGKVSPFLEIVAPIDSLRFWHGNIIKQKEVKEKVFELLK